MKLILGLKITEIYNASFGSWVLNVLRVIYLSYKFDRPETIRDRAKMNLAGHRVHRLSGNCFALTPVLKVRVFGTRKWLIDSEGL